MSTIVDATAKKKSEENLRNAPEVALCGFSTKMGGDPTIRNLVLILTACALLIGGGITALLMFKKPAAGKAPSGISVESKQTEIVAEKEMTDPTFKLDGIFGSEAIINGIVVRIGDNISGAKVLDISDEIVKIEYNGEIMEL